MPSKNSVKFYLENCYYHLYNRGVEKRLIFQDQQDYSVFLSYLKAYLDPKDINEITKRIADKNIPWGEREKLLKLLRLNNFSDEIELLAYCLMPNHFHLLVKQKSTGSIDKFMNSIGTRYSMYFNRKYKRVGSLYQDVYKAAIVKTDEQLLHLSRYIHQQAITLKSQPCSYYEYLGNRNTEWVKPQTVLSYFKDKTTSGTYESFMKENDHSIISKLIIEEA